MSGGYLKYLREVLPRLGGFKEVHQVSNLCHPNLLRNLRNDIPDVEHKTLSLRAIRDADILLLPSARTAASVALRRNCPLVALLQNMEPLVVPWDGNSAIDRLRNSARYVHARAAVASADRVIVLSEASGRYIRSRWHVPESKVGLVRHGVDTVPLEQRAAQLPVLRDPYILTVGSVRPARGLIEILQGYAILAEVVPGAPQLVVVGSVTSGAEAHASFLHTLAARLGIASRVRWLGELPPAQLATVFASARCFVTASHAEALPITALEAMAYGCRIVSTDLPPMPEIFGDTAEYFGRRNPQLLALAIREVLLEARETRDRHVCKARGRADAYRWDSAASETLEQLRLTVASFGRS